MYNVPVSAATNGGMPPMSAPSVARPAAASFPVARVSPAPLGVLDNIFNTRSVAGTAVLREATPVESASRAAIGLHWILGLLYQIENPDLQFEAAVRTIAKSLALCTFDGRRPPSACIDLWRVCVDCIEPTSEAERQTLAMAVDVGRMLADGRSHVGMASAATQGIWIRVGSMLANVWLKPFAANAQSAAPERRILRSVSLSMLRCNDAQGLRDCARRLANVADWLVRGAGGRQLSADVRDLVDALRDAANQVGDRSDLYYGALGRQLTHVGEYDQLAFDGRPMAQLR